MRHANDLTGKFDLALVRSDRKKLNLNFCRLSNGLFLSDLLLQRVAGSREPAPASEGPGLRMGHFSSGAPPSLAF
jgi:hypothetical protein